MLNYWIKTTVSYCRVVVTIPIAINITAKPLGVQTDDINPQLLCQAGDWLERCTCYCCHGSCCWGRVLVCPHEHSDPISKKFAARVHGGRCRWRERCDGVSFSQHKNVYHLPSMPIHLRYKKQVTVDQWSVTIECDGQGDETWANKCSSSSLSVSLEICPRIYLTLAMAGSTTLQATPGTYRHVINTVTKRVCIQTDLYSQFQMATMTRPKNHCN